MNLIVSSNPVARSRDDAPARWLLDILWLVLATGEDTNGGYSVIEQFMPVGSGPPPHIHPFEDEAFYILAGEMTAIIGGQEVVLGPGSLGHLPRNTVHEFKVTGTEVCHCLNYYTPAGFEQAILGCSRPAERRELPPPGLDAPDSTQVVRFFNNYWVAPAALPWAQQKWPRG
ncbi:cupin domain-containing protein [Dactylosporangium sp. AC04546]|uniref:cupin domain-containing protein n=1 Tax=Dactylosporangium sp. AC04546 TaxID=2862460 RepID=UPI001EDCD28B|nr:cupin domain-containing protein [Dactylosporangium sp. AC04546]WVK78783.1 cupin domain-containing protein [Dactylosporangium sp. AC04546]